MVSFAFYTITSQQHSAMALAESPRLCFMMCLFYSLHSDVDVKTALLQRWFSKFALIFHISQLQDHLFNPIPNPQT